MGYSKVNVHELEVAGPGGDVRFVRRDSVSGPVGINRRRCATRAVLVVKEG